ncbi:MAG: PAS domain-containing protein [Proteobacteria bacterium]|nr:PAS domain-containing protein [Pseudomonadota bacterium]
MSDRSSGAASDTLAVLAEAGPALATVDDADRIAWCSLAFAQALGTAPAAALTARPLAALLGAEAAAALLSTAVRSGTAGGPGLRLLRLPADDEGARLRQRIAALSARLELVQNCCHAGIFERDPQTMRGHWDRRMYEIYGLPPPADPNGSPGLDELAAMVVPDDRARLGFRLTLQQPGLHGARVRLQRPDGTVRHLHSQWLVGAAEEGGRVPPVLGVCTDDSEVFELARQAQTLREELDLACRLGRIGLWRHDLDSDRVSFDDNAIDLLGLQPQPDGKASVDARRLFHPDDLDAVLASREDTLRSGEPTDMLVRMRHADGRWLHVLARRSLQRDADGRPLAFLGVLLDETERVQRSRQAQQLAQRLEAAAEAARIGLWSSLADGTQALWNRRMFALFGLDPAGPAMALDERWLQRCVHPDDRAAVAARLAPWLREGSGPVEIEFRVRRPSDGALRWLVLRGAIDLRDEGQRRIEGVAIDITEQRETLAQLRETMERAALTATAVGLGSWVHEGDTDPVHWDEAMFRLRGVQSPGRVVSDDEMARYVHPDDRGWVMADRRQRLHSNEHWRRSFRVQWPDGTVRWLASRSVPIFDAQGRQVRRLGLNWDVTESVIAEQAVRERERAVAENRAKSQLLSRVSHELRTPLNAVLGFTELLRSERAGQDAALRRSWLDHVDVAGHHLLALIDDVLDLSRLDAGQMRISPQPVALEPLVRSTLPLVQQQAAEQDVAVAAEGALAGVVQADPVRLRQVLLNLLSNAIKYNQGGGRVQVSTQANDDGWRLLVADTGRGIEAESLRLLFEPFQRLDADASGIRGSGIGLAVSRALVLQMGGRIEVDSTPGEGSVFSVLLPGSAAAAAAPVPAPAAPLRTARVLYIEDNAVNALLVRELLRPHEDIRLEVAVDGHSGLALAREWQPHLVLLDMQLPDIDGIEVLRRLREDPATAALRCVALSANAMPADVAAAQAAGAIGYWTKPIEFGSFVARLQGLLDEG